MSSDDGALECGYENLLINFLFCFYCFNVIITLRIMFEFWLHKDFFLFIPI